MARKRTDHLTLRNRYPMLSVVANMPPHILSVIRSENILFQAEFNKQLDETSKKITNVTKSQHDYESTIKHRKDSMVFDYSIIIIIAYDDSSAAYTYSLLLFLLIVCSLLSCVY